MRIGDWHVGVRCRTSDDAGALREVLAEHVVEDPAVHKNFSLGFKGPDDQSVGAPLHLLYQGYAVVARSRGGPRLVRALVGALEVFLEDPLDPTRLHAGGVAFVRDGEAVIVPPHNADFRDRLEPRLARQGIQVVDGTVLTFDAGSGELVVEERLPYNEAALARFEELHPSPDNERLPAPPGRYRVRAWGLLRLTDEDEIGRAEAVRRALRHVRHSGERQPQAVLDTIRSVLGEGRWFVAKGDLGDLGAQIAAAFGR